MDVFKHFLNLYKLMNNKVYKTFYGQLFKVQERFLTTPRRVLKV